MSGTVAHIATTAERLRVEFGAEVKTSTRGNKSKLTALVPQEKARDAMREIMGL